MVNKCTNTFAGDQLYQSWVKNKPFKIYCFWVIWG